MQQLNAGTFANGALASAVVWQAVQAFTAMVLCHFYLLECILLAG